VSSDVTWAVARTNRLPAGEGRQLVLGREKKAEFAPLLIEVTATDVPQVNTSEPAAREAPPVLNVHRMAGAT
jgi:hypothetical protein